MRMMTPARYWRWKDDALPKRIWHYAKVLRRKATVISLEAAPYFYALSQNFGSIEEDHLVAYQDGRLTLAARNVYDALLSGGPLDSITLRKAARMAGAKESEWNRRCGSADGPQDPPVGVGAGSRRYAFISTIVASTSQLSRRRKITNHGAAAPAGTPPGPSALRRCDHQAAGDRATQRALHSSEAARW
jgi:hypothetical protein